MDYLQVTWIKRNLDALWCLCLDCKMRYFFLEIKRKVGDEEIRLFAKQVY